MTASTNSKTCSGTRASPPKPCSTTSSMTRILLHASRPGHRGSNRPVTIHRIEIDALAWTQRRNRASPTRRNHPEPPQTGQVGARVSPRMSGTGNWLALDAGQNALIADVFNSIRTKRISGRSSLQVLVASQADALPIASLPQRYTRNPTSPGLPAQQGLNLIAIGLRFHGHPISEVVLCFRKGTTAQ